MSTLLKTNIDCMACLDLALLGLLAKKARGKVERVFWKNVELGFAILIVGTILPNEAKKIVADSLYVEAEILKSEQVTESKLQEITKDFTPHYKSFWS